MAQEHGEGLELVAQPKLFCVDRERRVGHELGEPRHFVEIDIARQVQDDFVADAVGELEELLAADRTQLA